LTNVTRFIVPLPFPLVRPGFAHPQPAWEHHDYPVTLAPEVPTVLGADRLGAGAAGALLAVSPRAEVLNCHLAGV